MTSVAMVGSEKIASLRMRDLNPTASRESNSENLDATRDRACRIESNSGREHCRQQRTDGDRLRGHNESERGPFPDLEDGRVKSQHPPTDNSNSPYTPPQPPASSQSHYRLTPQSIRQHTVLRGEAVQSTCATSSDQTWSSYDPTPTANSPFPKSPSGSCRFPDC